jgi:hypothetical protein
MAQGIRWVGLDVHAHESTIAIFDQETGELTTKRVVGRRTTCWHGCAVSRGQHALCTKQARPGMGWRVVRGRRGSRSRCARRRGPIVARRIGSRPISATRSGSLVGWPPAS